MQFSELGLDISTELFDSNPLLMSLLINSDFIEEQEEKIITIISKKFAIEQFRKFIKEIEFIFEKKINEGYHLSFKEVDNSIKILNNSTQTQENVKPKNKIISAFGTLKEEYTFNNFILDETNELAYISIKRIDEDNTKNINIPVFTIVGKSGVGKTHLVTALLNNFKIRNNGHYAYFFTKNFYQQVIRSGFESKNTNSITNDIINAKIVVFDDFIFIAELPESYIKIIYDIVDARIMQNLPTIFTTPVHPENIIIKPKDYDNLKTNQAYFKYDEIKDVVTLSEPFLSRLCANVRNISLPSFKLRYSFFRKNLFLNGINIEDYGDEFIEKVAMFISLVNADFRIIGHYVNIFIDNYLTYHDVDIVIDNLLSSVEGKHTTSNFKVATNKIKTGRLKYLTVKISEILDYDILTLFGKKYVKDKLESYMLTVVCYVLSNICGFKHTAIADFFGVDRTKITRRVKDFEKIKNEPEVMELYEKIVQNDIIK